VALAGYASLAADRPPNIILILADDLGAGDLGCYGHPKFKTPRLDRLATQGVRFTQFNTPAPFCAPTRSALLTGRYPTRCGMPNNPSPDTSPESDAVHLPESERILPQYLQPAGYTTAMIGKWHLGHQRKECWPVARGFGDYLGILYSNDMRPVQLIEREQVLEYPLVQANLTHRYTQRAVDFIQQNHDKPFFLYLAHAMPHKPLACSEAFYKQSGAGLYGDVIAELDASVGTLLDKLEELKLTDNTLFVFTSDNGPWYGGSTGGLRGMKSTSWEGGTRVPCIARWPGHLPSGFVSPDLAATMDLFATILTAARVPLPADRTLDGSDLVAPLAAGQRLAPRYVLGQQGDRLATIRDKRWKLFVLPQHTPAAPKPGEERVDRRGPDGVTILAPYEQATRLEYPGLRTGDEVVALSLFDLEHDPTEQHNVAAEHPQEVARLKAEFDRLAAEFAAR
jgi:uncharacterized sulfatase